MPATQKWVANNLLRTTVLDIQKQFISKIGKIDDFRTPDGGIEEIKTDEIITNQGGSGGNYYPGSSSSYPNQGFPNQGSNQGFNQG